MEATNEHSPAAGGRKDRLNRDRAEEIRRNPPRHLSVPEAAAFLDISPRTVREHIANRRLSCIRLGGAIRLRLVDLERDLERLAIPAR